MFLVIAIAMSLFITWVFDLNMLGAVIVGLICGFIGMLIESARH